MTPFIIADAKLQAQLEQAAGPVPICTPDGRVLAFASPARPARLNLEPQIGEEELQRREQVGGGRTLADVLHEYQERMASPPANRETIVIRGNADRPVPSPLPTQTPEQAARVQAIIEQQGKVGKSTFENMLGAGKDLWDSDEEFEQFLKYTREARGKE